MVELFKWLSTNPVAGMVISIALGVLILSVVIVFLIAFFQGREILFWPPKIGARYSDPTNKKDKENGKENTESSSIRDISGIWEVAWIEIKEDGSEYTAKCTHTIEMKGKNSFEGEGKGISTDWHYSINGTIDDMGYMFGTWTSLINRNKGTFLMKLKPNLQFAEGYSLSTAGYEKEIRSGKWIWALKERKSRK